MDAKNLRLPQSGLRSSDATLSLDHGVGSKEPSASQPIALKSTVAVGESTPAISTHPSNIAGKTFGDYDLLEEIARGGMGVVYKARQRKLG